MNNNIINNAINKFISGNTNAGIKLLQKHIKKKPSDHLAIYNLGYFYQQLKNFELAKKIIWVLLKLIPITGKVKLIYHLYILSYKNIALP